MLRSSVCALLLVATTTLAWAVQNFEFRSSTGNTVRMVGTEKMHFQVQLLAPNGKIHFVRVISH